MTSATVSSVLAIRSASVRPISYTSLQAAGESSSSISSSLSLPMPWASTGVTASTVAAARGSVSSPISPTTVGAPTVARCCRRPWSPRLWTSTVPEVTTYSLSSGPPSRKMAWPTSKYAGSMSPSSSALSSASRCRKTGTDPRSGVPCIPAPPLHGPVCYEPVAEGLDVGLPPPLELPYGLDDLLVQARKPLGERAGYPVRELEGRRAALRDHPPEGLARYLDARHLARRR